MIPIIIGPVSPAECAEQSHREHVALLEAIEEGRADDAERLAREHIDRTLARIQERIDSGKADLQWYV